jgi:hypothetical protein
LWSIAAGDARPSLKNGKQRHRGAAVKVNKTTDVLEVAADRVERGLDTFEAVERAYDSRIVLVATRAGRACGVLTVDGEDVGDTLMSENLAHPLVYGRYSCPRPQPWCPFEQPQ